MNSLHRLTSVLFSCLSTRSPEITIISGQLCSILRRSAPVSSRIPYSANPQSAKFYSRRSRQESPLGMSFLSESIHYSANKEMPLREALHKYSPGFFFFIILLHPFVFLYIIKATTAAFKKYRNEKFLSSLKNDKKSGMLSESMFVF